MKKKILGMTALSLMPVIIGVSASLGFVQKEQTIEQIQGFNMVDDQQPLIDNQIVFGTFKDVNYYPAYTENEDIANNRTSNISKNAIYNPHFTINFLSNGQTLQIVTASLKTEAARGVTFTSLPAGTSSVISSHYVSDILWLTLLIDDEYFLVTYLVENPESGTPRIRQVNSQIRLPYTISTRPYPHIQPVIVPIHSLVEGQMVTRDKQILVMTQAERMNLLSSDSAFHLKRYTWVSETTPINENDNVDIGELPNQPDFVNSRALSLFAFDKEPFDPQGQADGNFTMGVYHSLKSDNTEVAYSAFENGVYQSTIYNERVNDDLFPNPWLITITLGNTMPYPKIVKNDDNFELFWLLPTTLSPQMIFSTTLNSDFLPLPITEQAKVLKMNELDGYNSITFVDYRPIGNFEQGTSYIPVSFTTQLGGARKIGLINWKDTTNVDYWNENAFISTELFFHDNFAAHNGQIANEQAFLTTVENVGDTIHLTYLANNINSPENSESVNRGGVGVFYEQTLKIGEDSNGKKQFQLAYDTTMPTQIITNTQLIENVTSQEQILTEIKAYASDFLRSNDFLEINNQIEAVNNSLKFIIEDGVRKASIMVKNSVGIYEDGIFKVPADLQPIEITLIEQPEQFLPFTITTNQQPAENIKASELVEKIDAAIPDDVLITPELLEKLKQDNILGSLESEAEIKITDTYIERLIGVTASADDFNGNAEFGFTFRGGNNNTQQRSLTLTGFHSGRIEQEKAEAEKEKAQAEAAANAAKSLTILVSSLVSGITVFIIILFSVIIYLQNKKKKAMFASLQAGMNLSQKMTSTQEKINLQEKNKDNLKEPIKVGQTKKIRKPISGPIKK